VPLPTTVLTGFLGAGKTTLLRRLLAEPHGLRIGLVMNELGQAGIEAGLGEGLLELTEGCVCCTSNPDLIAALGELSARGDLDRVVVETTGLANPLSLTFTLERPDLADLVRLDAVVTVVDPLNLDPAADEWRAQIRAADLIFFSKIDLATPAQLEAARAAVTKLNPSARLLEASATLPVDLLTDPDVDRARVVDEPRARHSGFAVVKLSETRPYDAVRIEDLLEQLPAEVFRAKGVLHTDEGWTLFHTVGGRLSVEPAEAPAHGESRVVLFGRALDEPRLREIFAECLA
jgi:G3E family GTPase